MTITASKIRRQKFEMACAGKSKAFDCQLSDKSRIGMFFMMLAVVVSFFK